MTASLTLAMLEATFRDLATRPARPTFDYGWHCGRCKVSGFSIYPLDACPMCGNQADPASDILGHHLGHRKQPSAENPRQIRRKTLG